VISIGLHHFGNVIDIAAYPGQTTKYIANVPRDEDVYTHRYKERYDQGYVNCHVVFPLLLLVFFYCPQWLVERVLLNQFLV
jgi:hypothetical protein